MFLCIDDYLLSLSSHVYVLVACTKPSVGVCFVSSGRIVNKHCELHVRLIQIENNTMRFNTFQTFGRVVEQQFLTILQLLSQMLPYCV